MRSALYDTIGEQYSHHRQPDSRIAAIIMHELGECRSIVNIGAGVGSYEPTDREIVAVEPSRVMISQRPNRIVPIVQARAESLPFGDNSFDCAMAILTLHHWSDVERGLQEAIRVSSKRIVLLTWVGFTTHFWLLDYFPEIKRIDEPMFPSIGQLSAYLGSVHTEVVPVPHDCTDGFLCAYWRRPEAYLDKNIRRAISTFSRIGNIAPGLERLESELKSGLWHDRYGELLDKQKVDYGYRVVVSEARAD